MDNKRITNGYLILPYSYLSILNTKNTADQVSDKISRELAYKLAINRDEQ